MSRPGLSEKGWLCLSIEPRGTIRLPPIESTLMAISANSCKRLAQLFVAAVLGIHAFFLWSVRGRIVRADPDFTASYTAGKILREGQGARLYSRQAQQEVQRRFANDSDIRTGPLSYIHPPFEALIFVPFTYFDYALAFALWSLLNLFILSVICYLLRERVAILNQVALWQLVALALAFFPVLANFHQGQDAILLLLFVTLSFCDLERGSDLLAGCWLGVGLFRFQLVVPLFVILAVWKGRKFFFGFITVAFAEFVASIAAVGFGGIRQYPSFVWSVVSQPALGGLPAHRSPNLLGLIAGWSFPGRSGPFIQAAVLTISATLFIWVLAAKTNIQKVQRFRLAFSAAILTALLVGYVTNTYDLCLVILPLALVADYIAQSTAGTSRSHLRLTLPAIVLCVSPLWFFLWMRWERLNLMAFFLLWWVVVIRKEITRVDSSKQRREQLALI